jgi:hypothetical protein
MDLHNLFFYVVPQYATERQKSNTGSPRVAKKLHNLFVIKDINFFFFLDDSYAFFYQKSELQGSLRKFVPSK